MSEGKIIGCAYCAMYEDGDLADREDIMQVRLAKIFNTKIDLALCVSNDILYGDIVVYGDRLGDSVGAAVSKINYCPMCGRQLRKRLIKSPATKVEPHY